MIPWWILTIAVFGINLMLWGLIGLLRLLDTSSLRRDPLEMRTKTILAQQEKLEKPAFGRVGLRDIAVLIAAHNEEAVIVDSLRAITKILSATQVYVVSDGSTDRTVELAQSTGVHVISTASNVGKAGALQEGIEAFELVQRYRAVMLLDADTRVEPHYFQAALPLFDDPRVVAVAGCVRAAWNGRTPVGELVAFHRQRIYTMTQHLLKFGQTWKRTNATHIVPGFASVYRTAVLPLIEVNPPGLVIEDFNMTFEVYHKKLGKVGFTPGAVAVTQDPGTLRDYVRQCKRWSLGLWQTVHRHPPRVGLFTVMLALLLMELLTSSLMLISLPLIAAILLLGNLLPVLLSVPFVGATHDVVASLFTPEMLLWGVVVPDLVVTLGVAIVHRQPRFLKFSCFFLFLRVLDAAIALYALPLAWATRSTGRWRSPARLTTDPPEPDPVQEQRAS